MALALAGYNAGEDAILKYGRRIPPYRETQECVRRISAYYNSIINPNLSNVALKVTKKQAKRIREKSFRAAYRLRAEYRSDLPVGWQNAAGQSITFKKNSSPLV